MRIIITVVSAFIFVSAFISCRSTKKLQTAINKKDTVITVNNIPSSPDSLKAGNKLFNTLDHNRINFKTFSAKIRVEYEDSKGKQPEVTANIRMKKDSIIWISIVGNLAFITKEAFRVRITKDHITIMNKLKDQVEEHPFNFIEEIAKIPLDFKTLQDLIVGNPVYLGDKVVSYKLTENRILLSTVGKYFKNLLTLSANNNLIERSKLDDIDVNLNRTGDLTYGKYENKSGVFFSTYREITVAEKTKVDIKLDFRQYDFNTELSYPFTIPKNYKTK
ncbi:MAG TPA: DUF4292 domain-containing protein [Chitinophagaceae bacterium]|nr:DUF4292 domain-containing protein [Chitinophagaceae bacterium]